MEAMTVWQQCELYRELMGRGAETEAELAVLAALDASLAKAGID